MNYIICTLQLDWPKESVLDLIEIWSSFEVLYNPKHTLYKNKHARYDTLSKIKNILQTKMSHITIEDIKIKMNYLRGQYSREMAKIRNSSKSGTGTDDIYHPQAYWFDKMKFLSGYISLKKEKQTNFDLPSNLMFCVYLNGYYSDCFVTGPSATSSVQESQLLDDTIIIDFPETVDQNSTTLLSPPPQKKFRTLEEPFTKEDDVLLKVSSAIDNITSCSTKKTVPEVSADIESFVEHLKFKMNEIKDTSLQDEIQFKIYSLVYEYTCKFKNL